MKFVSVQGRFKLLFTFLFAILLFSACDQGSSPEPPTDPDTIAYQEPATGDVIDTYNGVDIFYNEEVLKSHGRTTIDGYNCGKKYQCVEFAKRYYYLKLKHKMTNVWGHASQYFNPKVRDGAFNQDRGLLQFSNPSTSKPKVEDLIVWGGKYGHIAVVSMVGEHKIEVIQQNVGTTTRMQIGITTDGNKFGLSDTSISGWLRKR